MSKSQPSFIQVFPNMLGAEYCRLIIDRFERDDRRHASTVGRTEKRQDPARTGTILFLNDSMDDWKDVVIQTHAAVEKAVHEYAKEFRRSPVILSRDASAAAIPVSSASTQARVLSGMPTTPIWTRRNAFSHASCICPT
jgi:hypothetical protein